MLQLQLIHLINNSITFYHQNYLKSLPKSTYTLDRQKNTVKKIGMSEMKIIGQTYLSTLKTEFHQFFSNLSAYLHFRS